VLAAMGDTPAVVAVGCGESASDVLATAIVSTALAGRLRASGDPKTFSADSNAPAYYVLDVALTISCTFQFRSTDILEGQTVVAYPMNKAPQKHSTSLDLILNISQSAKLPFHVDLIALQSFPAKIVRTPHLAPEHRKTYNNVVQ
jgi:hypothetical protein